MSHQFMKPQSMAICIMNQNSTVLISRVTPKPVRKIAKQAIAMKPYMPICQAVRESVSALMAAIRPWPSDRPRIGAIRTIPRRQET